MFAHSNLFNGLGRWPGRFIPLNRSIETTDFQLFNKMLNEKCFREGTVHVTLGMHTDYTSLYILERRETAKIGGKKKVFTEKVNFLFVLGLTVILNI